MADVDLEPLLEASADGDWIAAEATRLTQTSDFSLLSLVERLGPVLTSTNTASRVAGVGLLTAVLDTASMVDKLEAKELNVLFMFYIDRVRDHHSLLPSTLHGLSLLTSHPDLSESHLETLLNSLQTEVMVQQQVVRDRSTVFLMLSRILSNKLALVRKMSTMFTMTLIQAGDGETDPRNLLILFATKLSILTSLDVKHHTEEIFESLACYFPVDFTPPSGIVASVTKEQLQQGLRQAITHPSLTSETLSLLIEKLDSDLESAKLDCLETLLVLSERCEERRQEVIEDWVKELPDLWTGLKRELMGLRMGGNTQLTSLASEAVTRVSRLLGSSLGEVRVGESEEAWAKWWALVWKDCKPGLSQSGTRLVTMASAVLVSVIRGGERQAGAVLENALPLIGQSLDQSQEGAAKRDVMLMAGQMMAAASDQEASGAMSQHLDKIFTTFLGQLSDADLTLSICRSAGLLSDKQRSELGQSLLAAIKLNTAGLGPAVAALAHWSPGLVEEVILPDLLRSDSITETSLECVASLWQAGMFATTLTPLMDRILICDDTSVMIVQKLASHKVTDRDQAKLGDLPSEIIGRLLDICPNWPDTGRDSMCELLSNLGSLLTPETWRPLEVRLTQGEVSVYLASVMESVTGEIVTTWPRDTVQRLASQDSEPSWRCVASIVNKCPELAASLDLAASSPGVGWVTVGLAKRGQNITDWVQRLLSQLETGAGDSVRMVVRCLEAPSWPHPVVGVLYKQRLWSQLLPGLTSGEVTSCHVSALVLSLPHLPPPLLKSSLPATLPRVVSALSDPDTCHAALTCLDTMTTSDPASVASHLTEIVHNCLAISLQASSTSPVRSRLLSLSVLAHCSSLESSTSVQLAARVTRDLKTVLADRKRLVRLEAARTRNRWFLLTQPS